MAHTSGDNYVNFEKEKVYIDARDRVITDIKAYLEEFKRKDRMLEILGNSRRSGRNSMLAFRIKTRGSDGVKLYIAYDNPTSSVPGIEEEVAKGLEHSLKVLNDHLGLFKKIYVRRIR